MDLFETWQPYSVHKNVAFNRSFFFIKKLQLYSQKNYVILKQILEKAWGKVKNFWVLT